MPPAQRIQFTATVKAPPRKVWETMFSPEHYPRWSAPFAEAGYYEGEWKEGSRIRFLAPGGDGMVAEVAECIPYERMALRHIGVVANGVEDTESEAVKAWAPTCEDYSFREVDGGTEITVAQEMTEEHVAPMRETWAKCFAIIAELCEGKAGRATGA